MAFIGITYAGWRTRQANLMENVLEGRRVYATFYEVSGWVDGGLIERLALPRSLRSKIRVLWEGRALATQRGADAMWSSSIALVGPYRGGVLGHLRWPPLAVELDWTVEQRESMAEHYFGRPGLTGRKLSSAMAAERRRLRRVDLFLPMSQWAADGLRRQGVPSGKIRVAHPGVRLDHWPFQEREPAIGRPVRLLFVGGDFDRKGGSLLLEALRLEPRLDAVLAIVTRDEVPEQAEVSVHRCEPNSPELKLLYGEADLFVLPTQADCFGHVLVEAMATGLPVIAGNVGGVGEVVDHGRTGWLIEPSVQALRSTLDEAIGDPRRLPTMGRRGRRRAEELFDGPRNDDTMLDHVLELVGQRK